MFQNSYQNGTFFEVFDPKLPQQKTKNLYKQLNVQPNNKVFDKELKTFIFQFNNPNSKIIFPREDKKQLYLIQQYLCLQVQFSSADWSIELTVSDLTKTKRRVMLSPAIHKLEKKPFFVKFPCPPVNHNTWTNFYVDLYSFMQAFKGQTYRSLDLIQITGIFRLRRIFTTHNLIPQLSQTNQDQLTLLPKNICFPPEIEHENLLLQFIDNNVQQMAQHIQTSTKSSSRIGTFKNIKKESVKKPNKQTKEPKSMKLVKQHKTETLIGEIKKFDKQEIINNKAQTKKNIEIIEKEEKKNQKGFKNEKKFLANTNGLQSLNRRQKKQYNQGEQVDKNAITPLSTGKNLKKRRQPLLKTQIPKIKSNTVQKQSINKINQPSSIKKIQKEQKINPWRLSAATKNQTEKCQKQIIQDQRRVQSAQAALLSTNSNNLHNFKTTKGRSFDKNSDVSRQQEYFQLSQKFSTVTEGRFFKNQLGSRNFNIQQTREHEDQIQQNIEVEANSYYSNSNSKDNDKKNLINNESDKGKQNKCLQINQKKIQQSINDSLDYLNQANPNQKQSLRPITQNQSYFNTSSRLGFGQKMMDRFMKQIERPYSPPLGDRQRQNYSDHEPRQSYNQDKQMELIYDPVLNCYYDHKTHTYYQLKN